MNKQQTRDYVKELEHRYFELERRLKTLDWDRDYSTMQYIQGQKDVLRDVIKRLG